MGKEPSELTDAERIAICVAAGCEMIYDVVPDALSCRMVVKTARPVGIAKLNGKFVVYESHAKR